MKNGEGNRKAAIKRKKNTRNILYTLVHIRPTYSWKGGGGKFSSILKHKVMRMSSSQFSCE